MTRWLKRLRGALGMGVVWSALWGAVGTLVVLWPGGLEASRYGASE